MNVLFGSLPKTPEASETERLSTVRVWLLEKTVTLENVRYMEQHMGALTFYLKDWGAVIYAPGAWLAVSLSRGQVQEAM
jgi:hypothetical protein